jgi:hypothetical protein
MDDRLGFMLMQVTHSSVIHKGTQVNTEHSSGRKELISYRGYGWQTLQYQELTSLHMTVAGLLSYSSEFASHPEINI